MKTTSTKIKEEDLKEFYVHCEGKTSLTEFREYCKNLIANSRAPNQEILRNIDVMSRTQLIFTINNFIMKGHGYGVV